MAKDLFKALDDAEQALINASEAFVENFGGVQNHGIEGPILSALQDVRLSQALAKQDPLLRPGLTTTVVAAPGGGTERVATSDVEPGVPSSEPNPGAVAPAPLSAAPGATMAEDKTLTVTEPQHVQSAFVQPNPEPAFTAENVPSNVASSSTVTEAPKPV